jgi:hypothetical protein
MQPCEDITYWAGYVTRYAVNHINPAATRAMASQVGRVRKTRANSSAVIWELGQTTAHESQRRRDDNWRCEVQAPSNKHVGSYRGSRDSDRSRDVVMCRRATQRRPPATRSVPVSQCPYSGELAKERSESMRGRGRGGGAENREQRHAWRVGRRTLQRLWCRGLRGRWLVSGGRAVVCVAARARHGREGTGQLVHCFWKPVSLGRWSLADGACWPKEREATSQSSWCGAWRLDESSQAAVSSAPLHPTTALQRAGARCSCRLKNLRAA